MNTNIFRDGVLVDIDVSFWSGAKVLRPEDLGLRPQDVADAYKLGKKFLVPSEVIKAFRRVEGKARYIAEENSFRFPIGTARFVPKRRFSKVLEQLKTCRDEYNALVDKLIENYDKYRQEMIPVYTQAAEVAFLNSSPDTHEFGPDYDREKEKKNFVETFLDRINTFYPPAESLREKFSLSWDVYEIALPRMREVSAEQVVMDENMRESAEHEYHEQMHQKMDVFVTDVVKVLRQETIEICTHISENLKSGKIVQGRTMASLKDFVEKFSSLNFVGDKTVEEQLERLRHEILDVYPVSKINDESELQAELSRRLIEIADVAAKTNDIDGISSQYRRRIQWNEEEENA